MTDRQELLLVLGAIYLAECFRWVRRGSVVFRRIAGPRWYRQAGSGIIGNDRGDLHWAWPFPGFGELVVSRGFPWSAGPEGVATWQPASPHPNGRPQQPIEFRRWDELGEIQLEGEKIFITNRLWWIADSQVEAQRLAGLLKRWVGLPAGQRPEAVRAALRESFDVAAVRQRMTETAPDLAGLRGVSAAIWCLLFLLLPAAIWRQGWFPALPVGLLGVYALGAWAAWRTVRLHARWYPRAGIERFRLRLLCGLSPVTAIRAADLVGRNRLEAFDPLAVALALLPQASAASVAAAWSRDAWFPRQPENPFPAGTAAASTAAGFVVEYREAGAAAIKSAGLDDAAFRRPPPPSEAVHTQYCGRCETQYLPTATVCQACGGRPLIPLASAGQGLKG